MSALRDYVDEGPVGKRRLPILVAPVVDDEDEDEEEAEAEATAKDVVPVPEEFDAEVFASAALDD